MAIDLDWHPCQAASTPAKVIHDTNARSKPNSSTPVASDSRCHQDAEKLDVLTSPAALSSSQRHRHLLTFTGATLSLTLFTAIATTELGAPHAIHPRYRKARRHPSTLPTHLRRQEVRQN
ncbi:hypothetical protein E2562_019359 [Oryza meyeriana var. granulata]|uniref:Uncharacterized protein n=1 Tax=Oryza meyeriana var. granulata TaxID=110450 RepID=A0A6G1BLD2_9ORYZ|nr:hypothetical protein E2562_019359 [Oryza meyeriana var. granulata]